MAIGEMVCLDDPDNDEYIHAVIEGVIPVPPAITPPTVETMSVSFRFDIKPVGFLKPIIILEKELISPNLSRNSVMNIEIDRQIRLWIDQEINFILEKIPISQSIFVNVGFKAPKLSSQYYHMFILEPARILESKQRESIITLIPPNISLPIVIEHLLEEPDLYALKKKRLRELLDILETIENPEENSNT